MTEHELTKLLFSLFDDLNDEQRESIHIISHCIFESLQSVSLFGISQLSDAVSDIAISNASKLGLNLSFINWDSSERSILFLATGISISIDRFGKQREEM